MKAITIHQPWAQLIAEGYKTIETRGHDRFRGLVGHTIAIHAGMPWCSKDVARTLFFASNINHRVPEGRILHLAHLSLGCIVAVASVMGHMPFADGYPDFEKDALCRCDFGTFGLCLSNVRKLLSPVPCRGFQGAWTVPAEVEAEIMEQLP